MTQKFVNTKNSRPGDKYEDVIKKIAEQKVCPFCPDQLKNFHKNPILIDGNFWLTTDNMYPYPNTKNHIIFIHKTHIENVNEISAPAWQELHSQITEISAKRNIAGGSVLLRFGDTDYTGASVTHLHAHIIQSDPQNGKYNDQTGLMARVG
jgi:ATP adenylyltransferase